MSENQFKTNESIASYGIGLQMGQQLVQSGFENLDTNAISKGIEDSLKNMELPSESISIPNPLITPIIIMETISSIRLNPLDCFFN